MNCHVGQVTCRSHAHCAVRRRTRGMTSRNTSYVREVLNACFLPRDASLSNEQAFSRPALKQTEAAGDDGERIRYHS